jgi:hypothetical protein
MESQKKKKKTKQNKTKLQKGGKPTYLAKEKRKGNWSTSPSLMERVETYDGGQNF